MENLIIKYLNKEATEDEKKVLLSWIKADTQNKKIFSEIYDVWLSSSNLLSSKSETDKAFLRFKMNLLSHEKEEEKPKFSLITRWTAAACILVLIFSFGGFLLGKKTSAPDITAQMYTVIMGKGSKGYITLPDSTMVWLNSDSRLIYPEVFPDDKRIVKLEGEGYFEVVKNDNAPFHVETGGMKISVLGTKFDVKNYSSAEIIETTLISGCVEVFFDNFKNSTILEPNQKIMYNKIDNELHINQLDAKEQIIWINDYLEFSNEKLSDIFRKLEFWYGIDINCTNKVNQNERISFTVRKETKEEIFKLLSLIVPITYKIDKNDVTINPK